MSKKLIAFLLVVLAVLSLVTVIYSNHDEDKNTAASSSDAVSSVFLAQSNQVFEPVLPDEPVILPRDFAFHNAFQHEWWHYFANVTDQYGEKYGIQWSYFRIASSDSDWSGWLSPQIFVSHIVVTHGKRVWREQRIARGGIGQAGMSNRPFRTWIDNWNWRSLAHTPFPGQLTVSTDEFDVQLTTITRGPYVLPGERGYRQKHDLLPVSSYNLSAPFLRAKGLLNLGDGRLLTVQGKAWMSKEWGSGLMAEGQQGWDWFVLHLDDEQTLSLSRYRHDKQLPYLFGTLATTDGKVVDLTSEDVKMAPLQSTMLPNGKVVPVRWSIDIPKHEISVTTQSVNANSWLPFVIPYWEGPVTTTGTHDANGFMQLTGY
ncbi:lipocalin-like domain-containing protein [Vibrio sinaloensis]|uniref:lipocalin-like domain-containing protein n=1 Tax=Photobacterium sp. (strain ATCC 43367) TaxID=379097 RepID=UPI00057FFD4C|nr:lipocalin-like domain-containing protein [Vibrio sinaloensis]KHT46641.1 ABC transporter [Vibrio sinaloensis]